MGVLAVIDHVNIHNVESSLVQTRLIGFNKVKVINDNFLSTEGDVRDEVEDDNHNLKAQKLW